MTSLGDIFLKFGATGAEGEQPLQFKTAHINLLVGPNNAGKSLMLRELSGVNPRSPKREPWEDVKFPPTRIVDAVHWTDEIAQPLQQEVVDNFQTIYPAWARLKTRSWDQLIPGLEDAATELADTRNRLCATLLEHAGTVESEWKQFASQTFPFSPKQGAALIIGGAIVLLQRHQIEVASAATELLENGGHSNRHKGTLTREQAAAVQQALEDALARCVGVLRTLGVDTEGLSIADFLDTKALGGVLLSALSTHYHLVRGMIEREPRLLHLPSPKSSDIERLQSFAIMGDWFLDPEPLTRLAKQLRGAYAVRTWAHPARRARLAQEALYLDGMARLSVTRSAELNAYNPKNEEDQPAILSLLRDPESMDLLRSLTEDALDAYLVLDMTSRAPKVVWKLSLEEPPKGLENSYSDDAHRFHAAATPLHGRSDGIHAFVGMLAAIVAKPSDLVFIDEPEAFLHPPLVRKLARQLTFLARTGEIQFFIATHSADLLESFVASGAEVNIIRLTHDSERSTARLLDSAALRQLARDPLLRSEATLSALFHEGAVICEAAADRVIYKEINERLLNDDDEHGLDSCVFLNAQNFQTIPRMMSPLRKMGVAAAAVMDSDVLFSGELSNILAAAQVGKDFRKSWLALRDSLREKVRERTGVAKGEKVALKGKDIADLTGTEKKIFAKLRSFLAEYGIFLVPVGELENWLTPLGLQPCSDKTKWLHKALDRLGQDPESETYVRPDEGDIWEFMRSVNAWILDPDREGTSPTPHQDD